MQSQKTLLQSQTQVQSQPQQPIKFGPFNVFSIIKKSHNNYGIKNTDYRRYRRYCTHKIKKIRKAMAFKYGTKTKFIKKDILKDNQNDKRVMQIALYNAQKYWAEANETKYSPYRNQAHKSRARFVSAKKLKKAITWSDSLCKITKQKSGYISTLESSSYKFYLQGMLAFEQQNWNQAQVKLIAARQIMDQLIKTSTSLSTQLFKQKIDQFDQTIKFCNFKISKGKDMPISEIIEMKKIGDPNLSSLLQNLTQQRLNEISLEENKDTNQIRFGNQTFPIMQQKILFQKSKVDAELKSLEEIKTKAFNNVYDQQFNEELMLFYSNIVVLIEEGIKITDQERQSGKKGDKYNQSEIQVLKKVSLLFQQMKIGVFIDRSYTIFRQNYNNVNRDRKGSPQTLAKLLTAISNNFSQLAETIKQKSAISGFSSVQQMNLIDQKCFYLRTLRLLFVGQVYFNNDKIKQAWGLWAECQKGLKILVSKEQMKNQKQVAQQQCDQLRCDLIPLSKIQQQLRYAKLRCIIKNHKSDQKSKVQITKMLQQTNIKQHQHSHNPTLQQLLNSSDQNTDISLQKLSSIEIIRLPGNLEAVPTRAIFFDIFQTTIAYPSLEGKIKPSAKGWGGWFAKLLK